jgi:alpha-L-fucosidase
MCLRKKINKMKKITYLLVCLTAFLNIGLAQKATLVRSAHIMQSPPFKECHASTIVELSKGKLLAAWFGGTRESNPDVEIWLSFYENGKWNTPLSIANGIVNDTLRYPCWNPVLFKTKEGKLFLFYKVGKNPRTWWGMMIFSYDDGKTWSKPQKLPENILGAIKNKPIQLQNGDILHPSSTESLDEKTWHIHLERCDKNGENWQTIAIENSNFGLIQPTILRYSKKKLQLLSRSRQNKVVQNWSFDNGKTWQPPTMTTLANPNSGIDAVTLKNGWQVLVYNPLAKGKEWSNGRNKLVVGVSKDGVNWTDVYTLEDEKTGEFSYPAIIQSVDGWVHITYTLNRKNIKYVVLNIKK